MKANAKPNLKVDQRVDTEGHSDRVVIRMLGKTNMELKPFEDKQGVVPDWFSETCEYNGYNWHISWLDIIEFG